MVSSCILSYCSPFRPGPGRPTGEPSSLPTRPSTAHLPLLVPSALQSGGKAELACLASAAPLGTCDYTWQRAHECRGGSDMPGLHLTPWLQPLLGEHLPGQRQTFLQQLWSRAAGIKRLDAVLGKEQSLPGSEPWAQKGGPEIQERDHVSKTPLEKTVVSSTAWEGHTYLC